MRRGHHVSTISSEVGSVSGAAEVELSTGQLRLKGDGFIDDQVRAAVDEAGLELVCPGQAPSTTAEDHVISSQQTTATTACLQHTAGGHCLQSRDELPALRQRLMVSGQLTMPVMVLPMGPEDMVELITGPERVGRAVAMVGDGASDAALAAATATAEPQPSLAAAPEEIGAR